MYLLYMHMCIPHVVQYPPEVVVSDPVRVSDDNQEVLGHPGILHVFAKYLER